MVRETGVAPVRLVSVRNQASCKHRRPGRSGVSPLWMAIHSACGEYSDLRSFMRSASIWFYGYLGAVVLWARRVVWKRGRLPSAENIAIVHFALPWYAAISRSGHSWWPVDGGALIGGCWAIRTRGHLLRDGDDGRCRNGVYYLFLIRPSTGPAAKTVCRGINVRVIDIFGIKLNFPYQPVDTLLCDRGICDPPRSLFYREILALAISAR